MRDGLNLTVWQGNKINDNEVVLNLLPKVLSAFYTKDNYDAFLCFTCVPTCVPWSKTLFRVIAGS